MSYLVLARKYRPAHFEDVIGQEAIAETLRNAIQTDRVAHAYLFTGQRGVGKTTMARIFSAALNCEKGPTVTPCGTCDSCTAIARGDDIDVLEIDGASNTGVDNIRDLRSNARYAPARSRFKIYYVDEVHMLSKSAFNALLKTLEEPPPHIKFIFSTTEPHRIPETILSRCQRFDFRSIPPQKVADQLRAILKAEKLKGSDDVLATLARRSRGSLRDALSLLDQLISATGGADDLDALERLLGLADREQVQAMGRAFANHDPAEGLAVLERLVDDGRSLAEFLNSFVEYLREALLVSTCGRDTSLVTVRDDRRAAVGELADAVGTSAILYAVQLCSETLRRLSRAADERLPVEMAIVKLCTTDSLVPLADLVDRLNNFGREGGAESASAGRPGGSGPAGRGPNRPTGPPPGRTPRAGGSGPPRSGPKAQADRPAPPVREPMQNETPTPPHPPGSGDAKWDAVIQEVADTRRRVAALLKAGSILSLDDDALVLGFDPDHRTFSEQLADRDTRTFIESKMHEVFGREIALQLAVTSPSMATSEEQGAQAPSAAPAEPKADDPALRKKAQDDPSVKTLLDVFGGRVTAVRRAGANEPTPADAAAD